jgi:parallel beta-helix repeat protein
MDEVTIYVDDDNTQGPWDGTMEHPYQYIQDAIRAASHGDSIFVYNGIYYENIIIKKQVRITGENYTNAIIDGRNNNTVVQIVHEGTTLESLTIRNSGGHQSNTGVELKSGRNRIKNCIFYRTRIGIYGNTSHENIVYNCTFHTTGRGLFLQSSDKTLIGGCYFSHNSIGIHLEHSDNTKIGYSYLHTNGIAGLFDKVSNCTISYCNISDNCVNIGGLFLLECLDMNISNCNIRHNGAGICLASSQNVSITHCNLRFNTHFAMSLRTRSHDIVISQCEISDNLRFGFYIEKDNSCTITDSNIRDNVLHGIYTTSARYNAQNTWWGSPFGPSITYLGPGSKITFIPGKTKVFPWATKPFEDVGADWKYNEPFMNGKLVKYIDKQIKIDGQDTDEDGAPDWWEEKWGYSPHISNDHVDLDPDQDALNNVEECYTDRYGSNPFRKDIFLEIDWMTSPNQDIPTKPPWDLIEYLVTVFDDHNISLHVDLGNLDGGEEIPPTCISNFKFDKLLDIYWTYFLHNELDNPRKGIFHYGIICNYCPDLNFPFFGWDQFDSFAISAQWLKEKHPLMSTGRLVVGGMIHHLGHTLGLISDTHGGIDNLQTLAPLTPQWWKYHNYKSCMNYYYKYKLFTFSDGTHGNGDFDDWNNLDFDFFKNSRFILNPNQSLL